MKFRSGSSKSAEKAIGIHICPSHSQPRRLESVSTLSSDSATDDTMQNENSPHHGTHGAQHAPISSGKDAQHRRSMKDKQPMTAIKIVNKSLRKKSGGKTASRSTPVKPTWCRSRSRENRKDVADTSLSRSAESDKKTTTLPLAGEQELLSVLDNQRKWSDKLKRDPCGVQVGKVPSSIGHCVSPLNMTKGYLV